MRWSYEEWGADAIFAGNKHDFDLVVRDDNGDGVGLPYVTSGLGGSRNEEPHVGANLVTVTDAGMLIEFYMVDGTLWDSYFVEAPAGGNPQFVNGHDVMNGSSGSDYLWGLGGNDTLTGFAGDDMMIGGDGDDMFVFHVGDGSDIVADFVPGSGTDDMVDLRDHGIDSLADFLQLAANQGPDVVADLGGGDQIVFLGAQVEQFHDDDFVTDILMA
jgi:Ca2+-binding RTX toxin-like protein